MNPGIYTSHVCLADRKIPQRYTKRRLHHFADVDRNAISCMALSETVFNNVLSKDLFKGKALTYFPCRPILLFLFIFVCFSVKRTAYLANSGRLCGTSNTPEWVVVNNLFGIESGPWNVNSKKFVYNAQFRSIAHPTLNTNVPNWANYTVQYSLSNFTQYRLHCTTTLLAFIW